jgi:hypothetical protein
MVEINYTIVAAGHCKCPQRASKCALTIVQRTHGGRCGQRLEDHLLPVALSGWEEQPFPGERLDGLRG